MHELSITQSVVSIVKEYAKGAKVKRVELEIGKLSAIMPDAIRFCFDVCTKNTLLEGAELEIREIPGRGRCQSCGEEIAFEQPFSQCPCGSFRVECIAGDEMKIKELEVY